MSPWSCMCSVYTVYHWLLLTLSPYSTGLLILLKGPLTWCQMRCLSTCRNTALVDRSLRMNFLTRTMTRKKTILSLWWNQSEAAQCRRCMQTVITFQKGGQRTALIGFCANFQTDFEWILWWLDWKLPCVLVFKETSQITGRTVWSDLSSKMAKYCCFKECAQKPNLFFFFRERRLLLKLKLQIRRNSVIETSWRSTHSNFYCVMVVFVVFSQGLRFYFSKHVFTAFRL